MSFAIQRTFSGVLPRKFAIQRKHSIMAALLGLVGGVQPAFAGGTNNDFQAFETLMTGWANGSLGRGLAIAAFLFGAVVGVAKQTAIPPLLGIVFAIVFLIGPGLIATLMTATI